MGKGMMRVDKQKCVYCGGCSAVCPYNAILLYDEANLEINEKICRHCSICSIFCPMNALRIVERV